MKKILGLIIVLPGVCLSQPDNYFGPKSGTTVSTSIVIQSWKVDGVEDRIAEGTFPIYLNLPIRENANIQIIHSPAISRFGETVLSGPSDTWIRGSYAFPNEKMMLSMGLGIPTGLTGLKNDEAMLSAMLSQNVFRFELPVFGQGLTASAGFMYAQPLSERLVLGSGLNFVYRSKYKVTRHMQKEFDPGEQVGLTMGFTYHASPKLRFALDLSYLYFLQDKVGDTEIFKAGNKLAAHGSFIYNGRKRMLMAFGRMRYASKNDIWNGIELATEDKNSNIFQMELDVIYRFKLSSTYAFDMLFEGRSYIENEYLLGQADIFGGGLGNHIQLTPHVNLTLQFKIYFGDAYFNGGVPDYSGNEFRIGTMIQL